MSQIASAIGNTQDAQFYQKKASEYVKTWEKYAQDPSGKHLKASYNDAGSWFMFYNMFGDKLCQTNLIESRIIKLQDSWYIQKANKYGVPLINTKPITLSDWEMFYAGASESKQLKNILYDGIANWLRDSKVRLPMPDAVDSTVNNSSFYINRPVVGGVFAPLAMKKNK